MIQTTSIAIDDKIYTHTYSDNNKYIRKIGTVEIYIEAIDIMESAYEYEEAVDIIEDETGVNEDVETILALIERGGE